MNVILTGFMGTGKSSVGRQLAQRLGWRFVDLDARIERRTGKSIPDIFASQGEAAFRKAERQCLDDALEDAGQVIATGGGAIVDVENRRRLKAAGPVICLVASPEQIYARVKRRIKQRPLLAEADDPLQRIRALLEERRAAYAQADLLLNTDGMTVSQVVRRVVAALNRHAAFQKARRRPGDAQGSA